LILSALTLGLGATAHAQPSPKVGAPPVQYNFSPPGARALAMGSAFIGLADDATASESNPAGLTILTKPEFSAHFRYSSLDNSAPDTVSGQGFAEFNDKVGSPGFFSFVYPWKQAALSVYFQRSADFRSHSLFDGVISTNVGTLPNTDQVETDFKVDNYGLSGAFKVGSMVSIGGSARITRVHLKSLQQTSFYATDFNGRRFTDGEIFSTGIRFDQAKSEFTWNAGLLFTPVSKLTIGGVYKKGASYDFPTNFFSEDVTINGTETIPPGPNDAITVTIRIPDTYGGGLALRPTENWTIVTDVVRVRYSQVNQYRADGSLVQNFYQVFGEGGGVKLEDATEFHVGTEYTWAGGSDWIFAIRGGYYSDPDHDGLPGIDTKQNHATFGGGVVIKNRLQVDVAANFAKRVKEGLISVVTRF
jgi:long-subunit fatty acid transport protein